MSSIYDWTQLGEKIFFRHSKRYVMEWLGEMDLSKCRAAIAPYGGHIAVMPTRQTPQTDQAVAPHKQRAFIFSANGSLKATINLPSAESITVVSLSWTRDEELCLVYSNANVDFYNIHGTLTGSHCLDSELRTLGVEECRLFFPVIPKKPLDLSDGTTTTTATPSGNSQAQLKEDLQHYKLLKRIGGVFLTAAPSWTFYIVQDIREPTKARKLVTVPGLVSPPTSWIAIPPPPPAANPIHAMIQSTESMEISSASSSPVSRFSRGRKKDKRDKPQDLPLGGGGSAQDLKLLVAKGTDLYIVSSREKTCTQLFHLNFTKPVIDMALSWHCDRIALLQDSGEVWVGLTADHLVTQLSKHVLRWESSSVTSPASSGYSADQEPPTKLMWCSDEAIAAVRSDTVQLIPANSSPQSDDRAPNFTFEPHMIIAQECDCIRVVTTDSHDTITLVPPVVVGIFYVLSTEPGAVLMEASREFDRGSHMSDIYLNTLRRKGEMPAAVEACIAAAGHEPRTSQQKSLLRAASFGKSFLLGSQCDPAPFVSMCKVLRILNAINPPPIAMPLTYSQLEHLTLSCLIDRLIRRKRFGLAMDICKFLNLPIQRGPARVLLHWAEYRISQAHLTDEKIAADVMARLGPNPMIPYAEVANRAIEAGRTELAIRLLDRELSARLQVPMLVKLKEHRQALQKAIESGDMDLVGHVIVHMRSTWNPSQFMITLRQYPIAYALHCKLLKAEDISRVRDLYYQEDDFMGEASCWLLAACRPSNAALLGAAASARSTVPTAGMRSAILEQRISSLQSARDAFKRASRQTSGSSQPEAQIYAQLTDEQIKLFNYQVKLEDKFNHTYAGLSLQATMRALMEDKEFRLADEMLKEFKVPERRYWWLKVGVLADQQNFLELEKFVKSTGRSGPPIGYEGVVEACLRADNKHEASKYLDKCQEENRVRLAARCGAFDLAAKWANEARDKTALEWVRGQLGPAQRQLSDSITQMIQLIR